jgi:hypothetical protein
VDAIGACYDPSITEILDLWITRVDGNHPVPDLGQRLGGRCPRARKTNH